MKRIAHIETDFSSKFGIPRQSGLVEELQGIIVFEPEYRNPAALIGLEGFSHLWLLWEFSQTKRDSWSATVRPPRLGGNKHMGVFATRSPFRPNPIGLSCVRLNRIEHDTKSGSVLHVSGIDMLSGTPIYDIKPYLPYADCHTDATEGFTKQNGEYELVVTLPEHLLDRIPVSKRTALLGVLAQDPRPAYQKEDNLRSYGFSFAGMEVKFYVKGKQLMVTEII